jgi:putative molybdopterin biosynthesis protein
VSDKDDTIVQKPISRLARIRRDRAIGVADLARAVGVSRQTIYAIEDGSYVPNTAVALRLGRTLGVTVEDLFSLPEVPEEFVKAEMLDPMGPALRPGQPVRLCRVEDRLIAVASNVVPVYLPSSDGVVGASQLDTVSVLSSPELQHNNRFLLAGCDPGLSLLAEHLRAVCAEVIAVPASSQRALTWLQEGKIHACGSHLLDSETGIYNVPQVRRHFQPGSVRVVTFARWRQGLLVKAGNPKSVHGMADLSRRDLILVNREAGSGSRKLLDAGLQAAGIAAESVHGYRHAAEGHLDVARRIASGEADAGIATESAARCFGLDFLPLAEERFDLTFTEASLALPVAQAILNALASGTFRARLRLIAGYETTETGNVQL